MTSLSNHTGSAARAVALFAASLTLMANLAQAQAAAKASYSPALPGAFQASYLEGAGKAIEPGGTMSQVKAFVYFDAPGDLANVNYDLVGPGLAAFKQLGHELDYSSSAPSGSPPSVPGPGQGAYRGAFVNPSKVGRAEPQDLGSFEASVGPLAIVHWFVRWPADKKQEKAQPATIDGQLEAIAHYQAIPLLDWDGCGPGTTGVSPLDADIASGQYDPYVYDFAEKLAAFGKPVFLRWFWEMNLGGHQDCAGGQDLATNETNYKAAWTRIWEIFHGQLEPKGDPPVNAPNVAFVWCPDASGSDFDAWYPGSSYVDWIGGDGFTTTEQFTQVFGSWYTWASTEDKPLMIGATGANGLAPRQPVPPPKQHCGHTCV